MKRSRVALGLFLATFATALLAVGSVNSGGRVVANPAATGSTVTQKCPAALAGYCEYAYDEAADAWDDFEGGYGIGCWSGAPQESCPQPKAIVPAKRSHDCDIYGDCFADDDFDYDYGVAAEDCNSDDSWRTAGNELVEKINVENDGLSAAVSVEQGAAVAPVAAVTTWSAPRWPTVLAPHKVWAKRWHEPGRSSLAVEAEALAPQGVVDVSALMGSDERVAPQPSVDNPLRRLGSTAQGVVDLWNSYRIVLGQLSKDAVELVGLPELVGRTYVTRSVPVEKTRTTRRSINFRQEF